jgi:hypothetical protein
LAPGVTLSSSGGGHRSQPDLAHILKHAAEAFAPSAPAGTQTPTGTTSDIDAQAKSTGSVATNTTSEDAEVNTSPVVSAVQAATQQAASTVAEVESKLHFNVANAAPASSLPNVLPSVQKTAADVEEAVSSIAKLGTGLIEAFSTTCTHCAGRASGIDGDRIHCGVRGAGIGCYHDGSRGPHVDHPDSYR